MAYIGAVRSGIPGATGPSIAPAPTLAPAPAPVSVRSIISARAKPTASQKAVEKGRRKGLAIAAAKRAAAFMRKGDKLETAWAKAGGESDVLFKLKQLHAAANLGAIILDSSDITEIAQAALSTLLAETTTSSRNISTPSVTSLITSGSTLSPFSVKQAAIPVKREPIATIRRPRPRYKPPVEQIVEDVLTEPAVIEEIAAGKPFPWLWVVGGAGVVGIYMAFRKKGK